MPPKKKSETRQFVTTHPLGTEVYTTDEVAALLKMSVRSVLRAIWQGKLKAKKTGREYLITREWVREYFDKLPDAELEPERR